ncbi:MAG: NTP transferase domain-containing protein [Promethearchaeota archaeon]
MSLRKNSLKDKIISIILCAGEGRRISDFIPSKPKPLIEIENKPILSYLIFNLIKSNTASIMIVTGHLQDQIERYVESIKQNDESLREKILIINSGNEYKKGPLYSFLTITREKKMLENDLIYLVFPGDTYFESNLISELFTSIRNNSSLFQNNSAIFYQKIKGKNLKKTKIPNKSISIIETKREEPEEIVKEIKQIELTSISENSYYQQIIPLFVFDYRIITDIIEIENVVSVKTIREIINILIKRKKKVYAFCIQPNYQFFDIDTRSDLLNLNQKKRGQ